MKKLTALILAILCLLSLASCHQETPKTEEELLRELADKIVTEKYPLIPIENCKVTIELRKDGTYAAEYEVLLCGRETNETVWFVFSKDGTAERFSYLHEGEISRFIPYVTEEMLVEAEAKIAERIKEYTDEAPDFHFRAEKGVTLYIFCEVIVETGPYDHEHKFFNEELYTIPKQ